MKQYVSNKDLVCKKIQNMLQDIRLSGQWSIDIMQNGSDFYIIDMALAKDSALKECVPEGLIRLQEEDWIPEIGGRNGQ